MFEKTAFRIRRVRAELKGVPAGLSGPVGTICKPKKRPKARETGTENRTYIAIDLKSFYASAECVARGLDPLSVNLVVADAGRTEKTICLAVSPALKSFGIQSRPRLFEVISAVREINAFRRSAAPGGRLTGSSCDRGELESSPCLAVDFITAPPRMAYYMETSMKIYGIYLKYIAPEDIHVYSIDEVFIDATGYLRTYGITARQLAVRMIKDVLAATGITATAGIGTNLYLCKVAMDIEAKRAPADADGVRIAQLDEESYRRLLWSHRPLTDFWRVGRGYARKLEAHGLATMGDIARCSIGRADEYYNEDLLYKMFGVNAELLIDHAWGWEPCTIADIKVYKPAGHSLSSGQVLTGPAGFDAARLIVREMADTLSLDLVAKGVKAGRVGLMVGYDTASLDPKRLGKDGSADLKAIAEHAVATYDGPVSIDRYGRRVPKPATGSIALPEPTSATSRICDAVDKLFLSIVDRRLLVRRLNVVAADVLTDEQLEERRQAAASEYTQPDLFAAMEAPVDSASADAAECEAMRSADGGSKDSPRGDAELHMQQTLLDIKRKFGRNSIIKAMDMFDDATGQQRNKQIGGHAA